PYFCWHPALGSVGSCRQCAIRKYRDEDDHQGQIVMSCMEPVTDNLHISIEEKEVRDFRKNVIEWLMINHPHDCPICDEGGECHLQDMTVMTGHAYRRNRFKKRTHLNQDLGPCINHEMNRCIQCYRCVRFYNQYAGGNDLQVFAAHDHVYFGRHEEGTLESEFSGNLVEVCPTGVFTDKTLKPHYTRKWDLTSAPSICQHCSLGCNTLAGERYGTLRRILSRFNEEVNGYFICDRGRFGYDFVNGDSRIKTASVRNNGQWDQLNQEDSLEKVTNLVSQGKIMGIGSPRASLESNYALRTLVGKENFYNGISAGENRLIQEALSFLRSNPIRNLSLKEIESCDAVIVIGEDVTNTAPMIHLALQQSMLARPLKKSKKAGIPPWNDAATREHIQDERGPLYMLTPQKTKLDSIATSCYRQSPQHLVNLVMAMAQHLDSSIPTALGNQQHQEDASEIATVLREAERPLVIAGTSLGHDALLKSALNLVKALNKVNPNTGVSLVFPECNSLGVAMMEEKSVAEAVDAQSSYETLIILENDLYSRHSSPLIQNFLERFQNIIVLDHTLNQSSSQADLILPAGTFAEADGTLVNNEARAQRYFQVQASGDHVMESWRWLSLCGISTENSKMDQWDNLDKVMQSLEDDLDQFKGISQAAPGADYRVKDQKVARSPHRYSGRTAMFAHHRVNEPRPPEDKDTPLSFTMEGYRGTPTPELTSYYWSPGWNSAQAINKFRNELGGNNEASLNGVRLIQPSTDRVSNYNLDLSGSGHKEDGWTIVPLHHIFGSESMSMLSPAIAERSPGPWVNINESEAKEMGISSGDVVQVIMDDLEISIAARTEASWPSGVLGITVGFPNMPFIEIDCLAQLKK
ncbi:MAG: NADH-quinone oxidoreductase subunit NuoG, partial [Cyclobacteriaceae bacterium]|nr:NADH-quinone oxidoreductase subunit NuoG [Cyclobacteriaceae bacterium]